VATPVRGGRLHPATHRLAFYVFAKDPNPTSVADIAERVAADTAPLPTSARPTALRSLRDHVRAVVARR
jgi:hypothetical protein